MLILRGHALARVLLFFLGACVSSGGVRHSISDAVGAASERPGAGPRPGAGAEVASLGDDEDTSDEQGAPGGLLEPAEPLPPLEPVDTDAGQVAVFRKGVRSATISESDARIAGLFLMDLGSAWVPALFRSAEAREHAYEETFVELANGRFDDSPEGRRARQDKFLELYGIPPTPALLRSRFDALSEKACLRDLKLARLRDFEGVAWDEDHAVPEGPVPQGVLDILKNRLRCEGHLLDPSGTNFDGVTRRALEEFERRNRIYARADLDGATLEALRKHPLELERLSLVRALAERMVLDLGVIEDGSGRGAEPKTARGQGVIEDAPNLVSRIEARVATAFGLETVAGLKRFYEAFSPSIDKRHALVAIDPIDLPKYESANMDLFVEIDRGDVYYEFPMDEQGGRKRQPVDAGPTLSVFTRHNDRVVPLVRYKTTIGGWRVQRVSDQSWWVYKGSPVGPRVWSRVVSTPVWLPPSDTPPETLVTQSSEAQDGESARELNYNLVGPGYASAYGLVAAYHERSGKTNAEGVPSDEGIRSHGTSDYTSIWRRSSHGCHRLYNHQAVRLFSFVVAHRAHRRIGHRSLDFRLPVEVPDFSGAVQVSRTGYVFDLSRPLPVEVLPGRIRGLLQRPSGERIPVPEPDGTGGAIGRSD